jgi:hypothetical protein
VNVRARRSLCTYPSPTLLHPAREVGVLNGMVWVRVKGRLSIAKISRPSMKMSHLKISAF